LKYSVIIHDVPVFVLYIKLFHSLLRETLAGREHLMSYGRLKNLKGAALTPGIGKSLHVCLFDLLPPWFSFIINFIWTLRKTFSSWVKQFYSSFLYACCDS